MVRFLIALLLLSTVAGHSYMVARNSWWYAKRRPHCRRGGPKGSDDGCDGPCITSDREWYTEPVMEWRRGARSSVKWHRNNHRHGFVRLTLVPAWDRNNKTAHDLHTFLYSCFDANREECDSTREWCGTGKHTSHISFEVPAVPDGDYVLGWSWYGAYDSAGKGAVTYKFGDYWSCTKVRVRGGSVPPSSSRPRPEFKSGTKHGFCNAIGNRLGVCTVEPCPHTYNDTPPRPMCPQGMVLRDAKCVGVGIRASTRVERLSPHASQQTHTHRKQSSFERAHHLNHSSHSNHSHPAMHSSRSWPNAPAATAVLPPSATPHQTPHQTSQRPPQRRSRPVSVEQLLADLPPANTP